MPSLDRNLLKDTIYNSSQTSVPKIVQDLLELKDGDKILWMRDEKGKIYVEKGEIVPAKKEQEDVILRNEKKP